MQGLIQLHNLKPHPKNPTLANFFKQLGWVEELGSGVRKMFKYCPLYINNSLPLIQEGDVFKITIKYEDIERMELDTEIGHDLRYDLGHDLRHDLQVNNVYVQVLKYLYINPFSKKELAEKLGQLNVSGHLSRTIKRLFEDELVEYLITDNPNHPSQKFKLTTKGIEYHKSIIEKQQ